VNHTLYVPVRMSEAGVLTLRTGRLESGERTGLAFTSQDALSRTLGPAQRWASLGEEPLRDMLAPLGIRRLRVDPLPFGPPGTRGTPRKRPAAHTYTPATPAHGGLPGRPRAFMSKTQDDPERLRLPAPRSTALGGGVGRRPRERYGTAEGRPRLRRQPKDSGDATKH
jgi:hypothetical protein